MLTVTGICIKCSFSPVVVYVPFLDMIRGPVETILNILLFIPMGFLLPILYSNYGSISKIALFGFLVSLSIEIVQLFGFGATDINDLITNTAGACLGFLLYKTFKKRIPESWIIRIRVDGPQCYYELPIFWIGSILIMLTIQLYIFHVFYPVIHASGEIQVWN